MINRILIRTKVVQMLYSYLLTRTEFSIAQAPDPAELSADKRYAYRVYVDLLELLLEISGYDTHRTAHKCATVVDRKLARAKMPKMLASDEAVRRIIFKEESDIDTLRPLAQELQDAIVESAAFADYKKRRSPDLSEEARMWTAVIDTVIARNKHLETTLRGMEGYSKVGFIRGVNMLTETVNSFYGANAGYDKALRDLDTSLTKAYDLYNSIFLLIVEITTEQERRIENAKYKHLATSDERNPNTRFIDNAFVRCLTESPELEKYAKDNGLGWTADINLVNRLLDLVLESDIYKQYMSAQSTDFDNDCELWRNILKSVIFVSDDFAEALEDKSVYWNDDLQIMGTFVLKTIKNTALSEDHKLQLLPKYKDEEDARFGAELFVDVVRNRETYRGYIDRFINTGSWDPERLAFMDIVIMMTAIAELINYPLIPIAVTMNEYIEIANSYSSPKSGQFVNGILYNVAAMLRQEGKIMK